MSEQINKVTGLLVLEVVNSNPNGNPDQESDPRVRANGRGEISPVSFKRKLRDLMELTDGPVYQRVTADLPDVPDGYEFKILESRGRKRDQIKEELGTDAKKFLDSVFVKKYWDARLFGNTFLEDGGDKEFIKTGIAQFGLGISIAPVRVQRQTWTNKAGVQAGKNQGMAPLSFRVVEHGVYVLPFFINPSLAHKSGCKPCDVELLKRLIPYAYDHTRSLVRTDIRIRYAWWLDHGDALGKVPDWKLIEALTPKRKDDAESPSAFWGDYDYDYDKVPAPSEILGIKVEDLVK
jgi:Cas7 group CRISPR-associated protein Csh2